MPEQRIQGELPDWRAARKGASALQVQRQVHGVQAAVQQLQAPVAAERRVERRDVVADVVARR